MSLQLKSMALCCTLLVSFDWWKLKTFRSPWPRNVSRLEHWVSSFGSQWARTCRHCDLRSNYVLKGPAQVIFCPTHNWVYLVSVVCVCVCVFVCMYNFVCTEGSPVEMHAPTYRNLSRRWLPRLLCYRPAVFCQLRLIAHSFPQGKIRNAFQNGCYFNFLTSFVSCMTWNCVSRGVSVYMSVWCVSSR